MSAESPSDLKFEIGHVLFVDIVGFSKLLISEQSDLLSKLKEIVRGTEQVRLAEAESKLMRLPTGDGGALVFRTTPETPVLCALEISKALKAYPKLHVRMGIHSGPVSEVADLNDRANVAGAGINIAQRVMDCGDAGHILLSKHVAEDLEHYARWRPLLHDLGECEVKHGVVVSVVNLYTDELGNRRPPQKFEGRKWKGVTTTAVPDLSKRAVIEKSVAVLPFENLSDDKANAYFASGIRDEIVTKLAQVEQLKVISRTSTEKYQSHSGDLSVVRRLLGVATVLQGSVQKSGDDVLINVRLIDTRTENHLWAESYRRTLKNIFEMEAEVAENVADALKIKLGRAQAKRLVAQATPNPRAHDLFLRAHALGAHSDERSHEQQVALLQQAVAEDPRYNAAWAELALALTELADAYRAPLEILAPLRHAALMAVESDEKAAEGHTWLGAVALLYDWNFPVAKRELERAIALNPNSSVARFWHARYLAQIERNLVAARAECDRARALEPLYTWPLLVESWVAIAQGDYAAALQFAEHLIEIDPHFLYDEDPIAHVYLAMGRWRDGVGRYEFLSASAFSIPNFELAICYACIGEIERAGRILAELEALSQHRYVDHTHIAAIHAFLGDKDKAFAALEQAYKDRSARVSTPRFYPWLAPLFDDPRLSALEDKIAHSAIVLSADQAVER
jgi:adenylate cyclase